MGWSDGGGVGWRQSDREGVGGGGVTGEGWGGGRGWEGEGGVVVE